MRWYKSNLWSYEFIPCIFSGLCFFKLRMAKMEYLVNDHQEFNIAGAGVEADNSTWSNI